MPVVDRLPDAVWPDEKNVGGAHLTLRYVAVPVLLTVALVTAAGLLPMAAGIAGFVVAGALIAAGVSLLEARTQKCPGYSVMGLNTCEIARPGDREQAPETDGLEEAA